MRRTSIWVFATALSCAGCALVGYDFDGYQSQDDGSGAASSGTAGSGGSGTAGSGSGGSPGQCTDGTQNNGETGIDCGGPCPLCSCATVHFQSRIDFDVTGSSTGIDVADIDGDNNQDLVIVSHAANSATVFRGNGNAQFTPGPTAIIAAGNAPQSVKIADFNADGALDFAMTNFGSGSITTFLNQSGSLTPQNIAAGVNPWGITAADLNGDSILDLLVSNMGSNALGLMLADGSGNFPASSGLSYSGATAPMGVAVADLDGDSDTDLVVAYRDFNGIGVFRHDAAMNTYFADVFAVASGPTQVALADFNGDGRLDIAATSSLSMGGTLLLNEVDKFVAAMDMLPFGGPTSAITAADFDGDTDIDIVASTANTLVVLAGNGNGSFQAVQILANLKKSDSIAAADFNNDDKLDIVAGSVDEPKFGVFLNTCP